MSKDWIQSAIKKPNSLRKALKVKKGKDIPAYKLKEAAEGKFGAKNAKRANLALTLKKLKKK